MSNLIIDVFKNTSTLLTLTVEEEQMLLSLAKGDNARVAQRSQETLARAYAPALRLAARRYRDRFRNSGFGYETTEDVAGVVLAAFVNLIHEFSPEKHGARLSHQINGYMDHDMLVEVANRFPVTVPHRTLARYWALDARAKSANVRVEEFAVDGNTMDRMSVGTFHAVRAVVGAPASGWEELAEQPQRGSAYATVEDRILSESALSVLSADQLAVVRMAFGFEGGVMDDVSIAARLGMNRMKVQRIRTTALRLMREHVGPVGDSLFSVRDQYEVEVAA